MVTVEYTPGEFALTVTGHAGSGDPGHDLVCAGVSALVLTARETLLQMEAAGQLELPLLEVTLGTARLRCTPAPGQEERAALVLHTVVTGLRLLQRLFGGCVQVWECRESRCQSDPAVR